jgi:hypothetical protein
MWWDAHEGMGWWMLFGGILWVILWVTIIYLASAFGGWFSRSRESDDPMGVACGGSAAGNDPQETITGIPSASVTAAASPAGSFIVEWNVQMAGALREADVEPKEHGPRWRVRIVGFLARRFGVRSVLPIVRGIGAGAS